MRDKSSATCIAEPSNSSRQRDAVEIGRSMSEGRAGRQLEGRRGAEASAQCSRRRSIHTQNVTWSEYESCTSTGGWRVRLGLKAAACRLCSAVCLSLHLPVSLPQHPVAVRIATDHWFGGGYRCSHSVRVCVRVRMCWRCDAGRRAGAQEEQQEKESERTNYWAAEGDQRGSTSANGRTTRDADQIRSDQTALPCSSPVTRRLDDQSH